MHFLGTKTYFTMGSSWSISIKIYSDVTKQVRVFPSLKQMHLKLITFCNSSMPPVSLPRPPRIKTTTASCTDTSSTLTPTPTKEKILDIRRASSSSTQRNSFDSESLQYYYGIGGGPNSAPLHYHNLDDDDDAALRISNRGVHDMV